MSRRTYAKRVYGASDDARFWAKVDKDGPVPAHRPDLGPCWLWTAALRNGYGAFRVDGRSGRAHRFAYQHLVGAIPDGLEPDHLCRNRACVNPAHMEIVTSAENTRRGLAGAHNGIKASCPQGHSYTIANTYVNRRGSRECRICKRARSRAFAQRPT